MKLNYFNNTTRKRILHFICVLSCLICIDQVLKNVLIIYFTGRSEYIIELTPILNIVSTWNYGISFGLFHNYYQLSNYVFLLLNSVIITYLCCLTITSKSSLSFAGFVPIVSGALSNLFDRFFHGAVFDFINFHYLGYSFPVFNLADSFITIGSVILFWEHIFMSTPKST